jgi:hypothetical protein
MTVTLRRFAKPIRFSRLFPVGPLTLSVLLLACFPLAAQATEEKTPSAPKSQRTARASQLRQVLDNLFVPPRSSAPKSTSSSATRNAAKCAPDEANIEAISPPLDHGLTLSDRPSIALNLPQTQAQQVALTLRSESGDWFETARLPIPPWPVSAVPAPVLPAPEWSSSPTPLGHSSQMQFPEVLPETRLVSFQLPPFSPPLKTGQRYRWSIVVVCGASVEPDDPTFTGWIEPQAPTLAIRQTLATLSPQEKLAWYGQNGYWYDLVQAAIELSQGRDWSLSPWPILGGYPLNGIR